jgi:predicted small secreted protein
MNKLILSAVTLMMVVSFYGCSTIKGLGDDIKTVGGWVSNGSEHVEESIKNNPPGSGMEK